MTIAARRFVLPLAALLASPLAAQAQPYCANYNDGERACGIPTLESCLQSVRGVGGTCGPDQTSQLPPNLIERRLEQAGQSGQRFLHPNRPREDEPGGLNWMPPPPGR